MKLMYLMVLLLAGSIGQLAFADDLHVVAFSLSTKGSFSSGAPGILAFVGSNLSGETDEDGSLFLGDLGVFTLKKPGKGADVFHSSDTFDLALTFLAPLGVEGSTVVEATLQGKVKHDKGSVFIDFGPAQSFTFANEAGSGGFDLTINDIKLNSKDGHHHAVSQVLTGKITNAFDPPSAVPEPQSVVLLGTLVLLTGFVLRRRPAHRM
jgi:hypothetical protein